MARRKQSQEQRKIKQRQQRRKPLVVGIIVLVGVLALFGWWLRGNLARQEIGEFVPSIGRDHIGVGDSHIPYNSDPPTSGPHAGPVDRGFYESPIPDENVVHNLEHGYVAISYDCNQLDDCETVKANLRNVLNRYDSHHLIAVPHTNKDAPIALTAWQRIDLLNQYDEDRIIAFIEAWRNRAPENVP